MYFGLYGFVGFDGVLFEYVLVVYVLYEVDGVF